MGKDIAIVGGGLAGLACAMGLEKAGIAYKLFEATPTLGGRVASYKRKQLMVDKGFQVFLPHYKTAQKLLDIKALDLCFYPSGANILTKDGQQWFGHRYPDALKTGKKIPMGWQDLLQLGLDILQGIRHPSKSGQQSIDHFKQKYSSKFSTHFLEPLFRGVFLDPSCEKSLHEFQYYLHCIFRKGAAIPKLGMQEIPKQLANKLTPSHIELNAPITKIDGNTLCLGETKHTFKHIVMATDFSTFHKLLNIPDPSEPWCSVTNYILAKKTDTTLSPLTLIACDSPISHINIPTLVSSHLAPTGTHYMNVSTFKDHDPKSIEHEVHSLTKEEDWAFVWHDSIPKALPKYQLTPHFNNPHISVCGDWTQFASIEGALLSGHQFLAKAKQL